MRVALVTARRAAEQLREVAHGIAERTGWTVDVVVAPVEIAALIPRDVLRRLLEGLKSYDLVIVPGRLPYDPAELARETGAPVVRGPDSLWDLWLLAELGEDGVERLLEKGRLDASVLLERWLGELRRRHLEAEAVEICGVGVPVRPPPLVVAAEIYVERGHEEDALDLAGELWERGADVLVLGFSGSWDRGEALRVLKATADRVGAPVAVDTPDPSLAVEALRGPACLLLSVAPWNIGWLDRLPKGSAVVATPVGSDMSVPGSPLERIETLRGVVGAARSRGFTVLADPIVDPPGMGSLGLSVASYFMASRELEGVPLLAGLANVYELMDADSHAALAVLTQVYAEAGASVVLVTEASHKTRMAVTEAAIAATMTGLSMLKRRPPKDLGVDLLYAKEKRPAARARRPPKRPSLSLKARHLASWRRFQPDPVGSHLIEVENGRVVDYYIGRKGTIRLEALRAEEAYKAAAYLGLASDPAHYAYLGYELCKAEHAARMRRSYVQERPLLEPPWTRNAPVYRARSREARRLGGGPLEEEQ